MFEAKITALDMKQNPSELVTLGEVGADTISKLVEDIDVVVCTKAHLLSIGHILTVEIRRVK